MPELMSGGQITPLLSFSFWPSARNLAVTLAVLIVTAYPALAQTSTKGCTEQERRHGP
jgi:hypothetical protein